MGAEYKRAWAIRWEVICSLHRIYRWRQCQQNAPKPCVLESIGAYE